MSHRASIMETTGLWRRTAAATIAVLLLPAAPPLQASSRGTWGYPSDIEVWRRVQVTILARGSGASTSTGKMDSYLVLISEGKNGEPVAARLVDYYSGSQQGLSDEAIVSHGQFRVSVTPAAYCVLDAKAFVVIHAFHPEAIDKIQGNLPCVVVRH